MCRSCSVLPIALCLFGDFSFSVARLLTLHFNHPPLSRIIMMKCGECSATYDADNNTGCPRSKETITEKYHPGNYVRLQCSILKYIYKKHAPHRADIFFLLSYILFHITLLSLLIFSWMHLCSSDPRWLAALLPFIFWLH